MNTFRRPLSTLSACLCVGLCVLCASAKTLTLGGHGASDGKAYAADSIEKLCRKGFIKVPSCSCDYKGTPSMECEKCTLAKHCPPGSATVASSYDGRECICGTTTTTTTTTTTKPFVEWPECPNTGPHAVTLVLDTSGSMSWNGRVESIRKILPHLLHHFLRPKDAVAMITFSSKPYLVLNMTKMPQVDAEFNKDVMKAIKANGATAIFDTLVTAAHISTFSPPGYGPIIIIISDGVDTASRQKKTDALLALGTWPNPKVLSIGLALDQTAGSVQKEIASATNGFFVNAEDTIDSVKDKFIDVASKLCAM